MQQRRGNLFIGTEKIQILQVPHKTEPFSHFHEFMNMSGFSRRGFTLLEIVIVTALMMVLALVAIPVTDVISQREKEERLRQTLLEMRVALDRYSEARSKAQQFPLYPATIGSLTETQMASGGYFLRGFPINPILATSAWQIVGTNSTRVVTDETMGLPDNLMIMDIRCPLEFPEFPIGVPVGTGINGIGYSDW